jgi:hypothetical protein
MCAWERFCAFAREPERRKVGGDARITVEGVVYEVDPELAGETVVLWYLVRKAGQGWVQRGDAGPSFGAVGVIRWAHVVAPARAGCPAP